MTLHTTTRLAAISALCFTVLVAGCSDGQNNAETDATSVDSAEQQLEQANQNLEQAQQNLASAKSEAKAERQDDKAAAAESANNAGKQTSTSDSRKPASPPAQTSTPKTSPEPAQQQAEADPKPAVCDNCGTVSSITPVRQNVDSGSGVGAIAGAAQLSPCRRG